MGTLHVVATPIGNLEDVTLRALRVLREADWIYAEDTRRTRILLDHHGISGRPVSLHERNEAGRIPEALKALDAGSSVALVSDAGTPLISDPGARLVAAAIAAGHDVDPVPGASAVLAALSLAGLPAEPFVFLGFLPRKRGERRALFQRYRGAPETLVMFESPKRISNTLQELSEIFPERSACVARELTKIHEEAVRGTVAELAERFSGDARGEITLLIGGALDSEQPRLEDLEAEIAARLARGQSPKEIAAEFADPPRIAKRDVYQRALALRDGGEA